MKGLLTGGRLLDAVPRPDRMSNGGLVRKSERKFIVFTSLVGVLTLTSALLLALAPAPLTADASNSLFAIDAPESLDAVFATATPAQAQQWKYIFIHQSKTLSGNASTLGQRTNGLGDHFLIGNGEGTFDGEVQFSQRWSRQAAALPPAGADKIDPACISICLVGDFDSTLPTPTQMRRLSQLVTLLQSRLGIPAENVILTSQNTATSASAGKYFPATAFRETLLP